MSEHPIEGLMNTAMNSIKDMVDVNTIIGEPIETSNNIIIIPISKVGFGFAAGGSEFKGETVEEIQYRLPFGGGSGAGVSITPIAFLVVQSGTVKLLPVSHSSAIDKLLDYVPDLVEKANNMLNKTIQNKKEEAQRRDKIVEKLDKQTLNHIVKETASKPEQIVNNIIKTKPRKNKITKPQVQSYEFEYDETIPVENYVDNEDDIEE